MEIQNSPIQPEPLMKPHHIRHMVSGTIVFLMGIAVNEALFWARQHATKQVRWIQTQTVTNYSRDRLPLSIPACEVGLLEDGTMVWRPVSK